MKYSAEQMQDINKQLGTTACTLIRIRDGWVCKGDSLWWRSSDGPEKILLIGAHLANARGFPMLYQIAEPECIMGFVSYKD